MKKANGILFKVTDGDIFNGTFIIPNNVFKINKFAFRGCNTLKSIIIPSCVRIIDTYAFKDCINLETVVIEDRVKRINSRAFDGCESIEKIIIPNSVSRIVNPLFTWANVKTIIIPDEPLFDVEEFILSLDNETEVINQSGTIIKRGKIYDI